MTTYRRAAVLDGDGQEVWSGPHAQRRDALDRLGLGAGAGRDVIAFLCGADERRDGTAFVEHGQLARAAQELGLVSREGTARGFVFLPPTGALLERCVAASNREHLRALGAVEFGLPVAYDGGSEEIRDLTASYLKAGRVFAIEDRRDDLRLTYAADPHLFNWLKGATLRADRLPYTIVTEIPVLRRFRSGELGALNRVREYRLPDVHTLVSASDAQAECLRMTRLAARALRHWAGEDWVQFVDITEGFEAEHPDLAAGMARAAGRPTLVNVLARAPRYYAMRSGLMPDSGTGPLLMYNIQWDEENAGRFGINLDDGAPLVILHANVAAGSGIMCLVVGRALAGLAPRALPVEIAPAQVVLQPLTDRHVEAAEAHRRRLEDHGLRAVTAECDGPLGKAIARHARDWRPYIGVVGDREVDGSLRLQRPGERERIDEAEFGLRHGAAIERCRPHVGTVMRPSPVLAGA